MGVELKCSLKSEKHYSCVICQTQIHNGDENCPCSTLRRKEFAYASLCANCAKVYDRLISDKELKPVLDHLLNKKYWEGAGPVIDF